jgi:toxin ParE1/3/4
VRRVVWSRDALSEFTGIVAYIARDNPAAASKMADQIEESVSSLAMPTGRRGRMSGTYEKVLPGLPYIIAYALEPTPGGEEVLAVLRIIHGARDWPEGQWPWNSKKRGDVRPAGPMLA